MKFSFKTITKDRSKNSVINQATTLPKLVVTCACLASSNWWIQNSRIPLLDQMRKSWSHKEWIHFFFLEHTGDLRINILRRGWEHPGYTGFVCFSGETKPVEINPTHQTVTLKPLKTFWLDPRPRQLSYPAGNWARMWVIPRAPAKSHSCSSSLMEERTPFRFGCSPSKTQQLRWFHSDQATKIIVELNPSLTGPSTLLFTLSHQSSKELLSGCRAKACKPIPCRTLNHNCREKKVRNSAAANGLLSPLLDHRKGNVQDGQSLHS